MLKIFYELQPFFEDNYRRIHVREYARLRRVSPPSASTLLSQLQKEGLVAREQERRYHFFSASRDLLFVALQRAYYQQQLSSLTEYLASEFLNPIIILFGSLAKAEATGRSDIDIAVFSPSKKKVNLVHYEKEFGRPIQLFVFKSKQDLKNNKELLHNILNGVILAGGW